MNRDFFTRRGSRVEWRPMLALVAGAAVGAAVALIATPVTGRQARAKLTRRSREAAHTVAEHGRTLWREQSDRVASAVDAGRREAASVIKRGVHSALDQAKEAYRTARPHRFGNGEDRMRESGGSAIGSRL